MCDVSVIVPVFNAEKYVERCIKCLKNQTKKNFEVIFINDGSTDNTEKILNKYIEENMRYYTYNNQGVSKSRNIGIEKSNGKYITFLDVDDEYDRSFVEKMYNAIKEKDADIAICNYYEKYINKSIEKKINVSKNFFEKENIKAELIPLFIGPLNTKEETTMAAVWRAIISKDILIQKNIKFENGMKYSEDVFFLINILAESQKACIVDECLYVYYKTKGSTLNKYVDDYININLDIHEKYKNIINKYSLDKYVHDRYEKNKLRMYTVLFSNAVRRKEKEESIKEIKEIINLFNSQSNNFYQIKKNLSWYEIITLCLIKMRCIRILYLCYFLKEDRRIKKLN